MAALLVLFVLALVFGLSMGLGVGWLAIVPLLALLAVAAWTVVVFAAGRTPSQVVRRTPRRTELLGPGGPDDPDRTT